MTKVIVVEETNDHCLTREVQFQIDKNTEAGNWRVRDVKLSTDAKGMVALIIFDEIEAEEQTS